MRWREGGKGVKRRKRCGTRRWRDRRRQKVERGERKAIMELMEGKAK